MQTYRFCFTSESTYQLDSSDCKGKERSRTLKALANSHVSQTATCVSFSSHAAHFTHSSRMFAFFLPGQEREWNQSCIVCLLSADSGEGGVTWVCFILCNVFRAQSAISVEILAFPSEYLCPYHKKRLPVLSFPQWQWESWPKILAPAMALPNVLLLPVISDYIIFGNEDIFAFWRSWSDPIPRQWGHEERQTRKLSRQLLSNPNCNSMLTFVKQKKIITCVRIIGWLLKIKLAAPGTLTPVINWGCKLTWPELQWKSLGTRPWSWEAEARDQLDRSSFRLQQRGSQLTADI